MSFHLHRGRSAEHLRKIRGRPPPKVRVVELMVRKMSSAAYGAAGKGESIVFICTAEDLPKIRVGYAKDMSRGAHGKENQ